MIQVQNFLPARALVLSMDGKGEKMVKKDIQGKSDIWKEGMSNIKRTETGTAEVLAPIWVTRFQEEVLRNDLMTP